MEVVRCKAMSCRPALARHGVRRRAPVDLQPARGIPANTLGLEGFCGYWVYSAYLSCLWHTCVLHAVIYLGRFLRMLSAISSAMLTWLSGCLGRCLSAIVTIGAAWQHVCRCMSMHACHTVYGVCASSYVAIQCNS